MGAAGGAAIGAIAGGHAGKGAGIGAIVGTLAGGAHREHKSDEAQARTRADQQQAQQSLAIYSRAYGACLEGRGSAGSVAPGDFKNAQLCELGAGRRG